MKAKVTKKQLRAQRRRNAQRRSKVGLGGAGPAVLKSKDFKAAYSTISNGGASFPAASVASVSHWVEEKPLQRNGKTGTLLRGCCPIADIAWNSAVPSAAPFDSYGAYGVSNSVLELNPADIFPANSPEQRTAYSYTRFRFTELGLIGNGLVSTTNASSLYLGYYPDGAVAETDITASFMQACPGTASMNLWNPCRETKVSSQLPKEDLFFVDADAAGGDSGYRQSYQGAITGRWRTAPTATIEAGILWMTYTLELFDARVAVDLALSNPKGSRGAAHHRKREECKRIAAEKLKIASAVSSDQEPLQAPALSDERSEGYYRVKLAREQFAPDKRSGSTERKSK